MTTEELQAQKLQLEIDKLESDRKKSGKFFLVSSEFWKAVMPTLGILATLYVTVGRGFIDDEKRKLELQKEQLKLENLQFDSKNIDIQKKIAASTIDKNSLESKINILQNQKSALTGNIALLKNSVTKLNATINDLNFETYSIRAEYEGIKSDYSRDTAYYRTVISKRFITDDSFKKQLATLKAKNTVLSDTILDLIVANNYLKNKKKFSRLDLINMDEAVHKASIERNNKEIEKYSKQAEALTKSAERSGRAADKLRIEAERLDNQLSGMQQVHLPSLLELSKQRKEERKQKQVIKNKK